MKDGKQWRATFRVLHVRPQGNKHECYDVVCCMISPESRLSVPLEAVDVSAPLSLVILGLWDREGL